MKTKQSFILLSLLALALSVHNPVLANGYASGNSNLYAYGDTLEQGTSFDLNIILNNQSDSICGLQFDVVKPAGFSFCYDGYGDLDVTGLRHSKITTEAAIQQDSSLRVLAYSAKNYTYQGTTGAVVSIKVSVGNGLKAGNYQFVIRNIVLSKLSGKSVSTIQPSNVTVNFYVKADVSNIIQFADPVVKSICVNHWDTDLDGELSFDEAAAVTQFNQEFRDSGKARQFDELRYFTSLGTIGKYAFEGSGIERLSIPDNVVNIYDGAFMCMYNLESISIGRNVSFIGNDILQSTDKLSYITVDSLNSVFDSRNNCNAIISTADNVLLKGSKNTVIPDDVVWIASLAMSGIDGLESITIPASVQGVDTYAFIQNVDLKDVYYEGSNMKISSYAFPSYGVTFHVNSSSLYQFVYSDAWNQFESFVSPSDTVYASFNVNGLQYRYFYPDNLGEVYLTFPGYGENNTYSGLVEVPDHVTFNGNTSVVTEIGERAFYCHFSELSGWVTDLPLSVTLPPTLKAIRHMAFSARKALTEIDLPNSIMELDSYIFMLSGIKEITIPESVTSTSGALFFGADSLTDIYIKSFRVPDTYGMLAEDYQLETITLHVPELAYDKYSNNNYWGMFSNITGYDYFPQDVYIGSSLEIPSNYRPSNIPNFYIGTYNDEIGSLSVYGDSLLSAGTYYQVFEPGWDFLNNYWDFSYNDIRPIQLHSTLLNYSPMRADRVNMMGSFYTGRWHFISLPYNVRVSDIVPDEDYEFCYWTIRGYNGNARANSDFDNTWYTLSDDDILEAGKAYAVMAYNFAYYDESTGRTHIYALSYLRFPAMNDSHKNDIFANGDVDVALDANPSEFNHNRGWNFVGNPYPCYYDTRNMSLQSPFIVWDPYQRIYKAFSPVDDSYIMLPFEGFFVQAPVGVDKITFASDGRQAESLPNDYYQAPSRNGNASSGRQVFNLILSGNEMSDRARFVINEEAVNAYNSNVDAGKFLSTDTETAQLYVIDAGIEYAIDERPLGDGKVQLGFSAARKGTYTLSLQAGSGNRVKLYDSLNDTWTVLSDVAYTFSSDQGTFNNRLTLFLDGVTGVDAVDNPQNGIRYNLEGKSVDDSFKGVVIEQGRKTLTK